MAPTSVFYSPPMEEPREPDVIEKPARPVEQMPPPDAMATGPLIEVPVPESVRAALIREHRQIT